MVINPGSSLIIFRTAYPCSIIFFIAPILRQKAIQSILQLPTTQNAKNPWLLTEGGRLRESNCRGSFTRRSAVTPTFFWRECFVWNIEVTIICKSVLVLKVLLILSTIHTRTIFTYDIHNVMYDCHAIRGSLERG